MCIQRYCVIVILRPCALAVCLSQLSASTFIVSLNKALSYDKQREKQLILPYICVYINMNTHCVLSACVFERIPSKIIKAMAIGFCRIIDHMPRNKRKKDEKGDRQSWRSNIHWERERQTVMKSGDGKRVHFLETPEYLYVRLTTAWVNTRSGNAIQNPIAEKGNRNLKRERELSGFVY